MSTLNEILEGIAAPDQESLRFWGSINSDDQRIFVVIDDDPTGTQAIADLPVLMRWEVADFEWAFRQRKPAVYVMANSRALHPLEATARNTEIVTKALTAAANSGHQLGFISRSDSTLRGHFPLEPHAIASALTVLANISTDAIVVIPAFPDAGRITSNQIHYAGSFASGEFTPVGETEFATDSTFGYQNSHLAQWVEEKSAGTIPASSVVAIELPTIRSGVDKVSSVINDAPTGCVIVVDCIAEEDLRVVALAMRRAENGGKNFVYRVGPPFVRALIGQTVRPPLESGDIALMIDSGGAPARTQGGLIVVGSHTSVTSVQLQELQSTRSISSLEISVEDLLADDQRPRLIRSIVAELCVLLAQGSVVLSTSRIRISGSTEQESLNIARTTSEAISTIVAQVISHITPRFVVAKGGITSSDVAQFGLGITKAMARGSLLPGIVSLWEPLEGPARGVPYVVFPGNVGSPQALSDIVYKLEGTLS